MALIVTPHPTDCFGPIATIRFSHKLIEFRHQRQDAVTQRVAPSYTEIRRFYLISINRDKVSQTRANHEDLQKVDASQTLAFEADYSLGRDNHESGLLGRSTECCSHTCTSPWSEVAAASSQAVTSSTSIT